MASWSIAAIFSLSTLAAAAAPPSPLLVELTPLELGGSSIGGSEDDGRSSEVVFFQGVAYAARTVERGSHRHLEEAEAEESEFLRPPDPAFYSCLVSVIAIICTAGIMAGCTMGVLSLDPLKLKLKLLEGTADEKAWATAVLPVLQSHHHLLVALLLCNAAANEALPIFLNRLVDEGTAVLISVTCVLIFGEILPSAVMTGPAQLRIAAAVAPFIKGLLIVTAPISWPMAKGLDLWLGHQVKSPSESFRVLPSPSESFRVLPSPSESSLTPSGLWCGHQDGMTRFKRNEFKALIKLQHRAKGWKARADRPTWSRAASRSNLSRQGSGKGGSISAPISAPSSAPSSAPPAEKIKQLAEMINGQRSLSEASSDKSPLPAAHEKHGRCLPWLHATAM